MSSRLLSALLALLVLILGVGSLLGLPSCLILLSAGLPWLAFWVRRFGWIFSIVCAAIAGLSLLFGVLIVTADLHLAMLATLEIVFTLAGLAGAVLVWRSGTALRRPERSWFISGVPAMLGAGVWVVVELTALVFPGAAKIAWTMLGDSANNVLLMRGILHEHGIAVGAGENPVPLPSALFAVIAASGRGSVQPAGLLAHDISSLVLLWSGLIVFACIAAGLAVGHIARASGARPVVVGLASAAASLLPLSWFVAGYAIEYGFLDALLAIALVLFAFISFSARGQHDAAALVVLLLAATLLLAVWSPLVLLPGVLALIVLARGWRSLLHAPALAKVAFFLALGQLLLYALCVAVPMLLHSGAILTTAGAIFVFHNWMAAAIALVALAAAVLTGRMSGWRPFVGLVGMIVAAVLGVGALLFVSRNQPSPWTYYPVKFWWLCGIVFLVLALGFLVAIATKWLRPLGLQFAALVVIGGLTALFLSWTATAEPGYPARNPVERILAARSLGTGDAVADRILGYVNPKRPIVLWHSNDPAAGAINFWAWEMWAGSLKTHFNLRVAAYGHYNENRVSDLCRVVGLLGGHAIVYTKDTGLQRSLDVACPNRRVTIVLQGTK